LRKNTIGESKQVKANKSIFLENIQKEAAKGGLFCNPRLAMFWTRQKLPTAIS
jgi:hypothetical protein